MRWITMRVIALRHGALLCALLLACSERPSRVDDGSRLRDIPEAHGVRAFAPSELRVAGPTHPFLERSDRACADCHPEIVQQWQQSAHAFSSFNNPIYMASVERLRREVSFEASRLCAGCHDPVLLLSGGIDSPIRADDPRAYAGVTCLTCHGIEEFDSVGNASYQLRAPDRLRPILGDTASIAQHRQAMGSPDLANPGLCAGCHRSFLDARVGNPDHLVGVDDVTPWQRSAFAGSRTARLGNGPTPQTCQTCHMPQGLSTRGVQAGKRVASHRFDGGHTWLAQMLSAPDLTAGTERQLRRAIELDIAVVEADDRRWLAPTQVTGPLPERLVFHVVIENVGVGHQFPGGTRDLPEVWLDVTLEDASGQLLAASRRSETWPDPGVHPLVALPADAEGQPVLDHRTHDFRSSVVDTTLAPHGLQLVRYGVAVGDVGGAAGGSPPALPWRLTVVARHRSRNPSMQAVACAASRSPRGQAFAAGAREHSGAALDPCGEQPTTELQRASIEVGGAPPGAATTVASPQHGARLLNYARALQAELPENLDLTLGWLIEAFQQAYLTDPEQAGWALSLAELHAAQGRTPQALQLTAEARTLAGQHEALSAAEASSLALVWRFSEAANAYRAAVVAAPRDDRLWLGLARSLLSTGDVAGAGQAAVLGLKRQPRSAELSLVLAQSYHAIDAEAPRSAAARDDYLARRAPDQAPRIAADCRRQSDTCRQEQLPVHEHTLDILPRH